MSDFQLASGRAKRAAVPTTTHDTAGFVLPNGTRFTVGNTVTLSATEIATPTVAILADTTATYIGPAPDYFRYYSDTVNLWKILATIVLSSSILDFSNSDNSMYLLISVGGM